MCHQIDSCAAKSEKLQLLLSGIGIFFRPPLLERMPSLLCFHVFFVFECVYVSVLYWGRQTSHASLV